MTVLSRTIRAALALALTLTMVLPASVFAADQLVVDGDAVLSADTLNISDCSTLPLSYKGTAALRYSAGGAHWAPGATVTVTATPEAGSPAGLTTSGPHSVTLPSAWGPNSADVIVEFTTSVAANIPNGNHKINVTASGAKAGAGGGTHTADQSFVVNIKCSVSDTTAPVITKTVTGTLGSNGWYTSNVLVDWTVTDPESTPVLTGCADTTFSAETTFVTSSCSATSAGGTASDSVTLKIDKTAPSANLAVTSGTAGSNGWYTSNVEVTTTGSDSVSSPVTCTAVQSLTSETTGTQVNGSCTNDAGLTTNASALTVKIDTTAPSAELSVLSGTPGSNGWYTSAVTVGTSGSDSVSGPVSCTANQVFATETTGTTVNGSCTNAAGLTAHATSLGIKIDLTGPSAALLASGTAGANGWYTANVTITTVGSDPSGGSVTCTAPQEQTTETTGTEFNGSCTNDAGLTTNADALTVKVDKTAPTSVALTPSGTAGTNGWYTSDVEVTTSGTDAISGVTCTPAQNLTGETAGSQVSGSCTNGAGLTTNASAITVKIDKTGPSANLAVTAGTAGLNGWYTSNVTVSTSGSDTISSPVTCSAAQHQTTETSGTEFNGSCTNHAGLSTNAAALTVKLDKTAPTIEAAYDPAANSFGWNNSASVTVSYTCADNRSGIDTTYATTATHVAGCPKDDVVTAEGIHAFAGRATQDQAGHVTVLEPAPEVKIDRTAPAFQRGATSGTLGLNGWYTTDVSVAHTASDALSGLADHNDGSFSLTTSGEGAGVQTNSETVSDKADNSATAGPLSFDVDKTNPIVAVASRTAANTDGWNNTDVTVTFSCSDAQSGVATAPASVTLTGNGANQSASSTCVDSAGRSTTLTLNNINIDKTKPTVSGGAAPAPNTAGWNNTDVTVTFQCADALSGIKSCTSPVTLGEGANQSVNGTAVDFAGNSESATVSGINVDKTKPIVTINGAASSTTLDVCSVPSKPTYEASDLLSGLETHSDSWTTPSAATGVGNYTYTATATDRAGNVQTATRTYQVTYGAAYSGILQPINADGTSRFKLGSTIPVKFRVVCNGLPVTNASASLTVKQGDSNPDPGVDEAISTAASTDGNLFRYSDGQYIFNLNTKAGYKNPGATTTTAFSQGTWTLGIHLDDGTSRTVKIQLVK